MVRPKKERTRAKFTAETMAAAVDAVRITGMSLRQAADIYDVKFATLRRYVQKQKEDPNARMEPKYAVRLVFTKTQEESLCNYIKTCSKMAYGLNSKKARQIAYEMAIHNNLKVPGNWTRTKSASKDWLRAFIKRTGCLSIRKPEACSLSRLTSFNKHNVGIFFSNLEKVYKENPSVVEKIRIYNMDETKTCTVQDPKKVLAEKGVKQLNQCSSAERGVLVTTLAIIRADGTFIPPAMVFPRKKFKQIMLNGAPPGTLGLANPSGWMTSELFLDVLKHFIGHTNTTKENPSILIYDNHESHVSLEIAETAKKSGVLIVTIPPHTSNKLQPLDKSVYSSFKSFYNDAIDSWLVNHPGIPMTIYQVAECVGKAHSKAMNPENIMSGFKSTGIYPFNKNIFSESDFLLSSVTDRSQENGQETVDTICEGDNRFENLNDFDPCPGTSDMSSHQAHSDVSFISPEQFIGFPKAGPRKTKTNRRTKKSIILTSTPEMKDLSYKIDSKKASKKISDKTKQNLLELTTEKKAKTKRNNNNRKDSETDSSNSGSVEFQDSSDDEDFLKNLYCEAETEKNKMQLIEQNGDLKIEKGLFVLVKFPKNVYFVGKILNVYNCEEYEISYLRKSSKITNGFHFPDVPDIHMVLKTDIVMVLDHPIQISNKRLASYYKFEINFENMDIR